MSYSQKYLIRKYFNLLFEEFIEDQKHRDVKIIFQDFSDSRIQGQTRRNKTKKVSQKFMTFMDKKNCPLKKVLFPPKFELVVVFFW